MCSWIMGRLPGPVRHAARGDQLPARFFQPVMVALALSAGVFRAGLLAERVQHRVQRGGALRGQITLRPGPRRAGCGPAAATDPRTRHHRRRCRAGRSGGASPPPARPDPPVPRRPPRRPAGSHPRPPACLRGACRSRRRSPAPTTPRSSPAASASPTAGWAASRRAQPTAPAAAPLVIRVCHRSHALAEPCPSSSQPPEEMNAANAPARAAVCSDSARSNPRRHSACAAAGSDAISALARYASAAWAIATASAALTGTPAAPAAAAVAGAAAGGAAGSAADRGGWPGRHIAGGTSLFESMFIH